MKRRDLFKSSLIAFLSLSSMMKAEPSKNTQIPQTNKKPSKGPHIVVVGGGWSGLSFAKHVKEYVPHANVTLVEKRDHFVSCPASNAWLFDLVDLEFLTHSFIDAANNHNYTYLQAEATGLNAKENILSTTKGDLHYDYLVFATGIEYDYYVWSKGDNAFEKRIQREYPPAFIPGSEHLTLKRKIKHFKGGNFIITVPNGNYRCLPAPYERACLLADHIKRNKIKGKVVILDANNTVTIKEEGFLSAFKELYKEELVYMPSTTIESIDLDKKTVVTEFDEIPFEDAAFYPNVRAPKLLEKLGLTTKTPYNRIEANLDVYTYRFKGHDNIFGCGDLRPMGFSKSGNTAYTEGANVAKMVADAIGKNAIKWKSPITFCVSLISMKPQREISLLSEYTYGSKGETKFAKTISDEDWRDNTLGKHKSQFTWAKSMYDNMFYT
ncbi:FAD-dependent oxidoreductase [Sulfurovum sp. ST-21]|uniref:NAD(P)/FAD-dependent oxidoreductase n=1 Tax=Sulfurovum indicum TaxID=2779528 RepID=A0A7M1S5V7_9BACT|nr:FAD/NAD(P)-binding oxidoreductase [Sulfurovum indicum]QOR62462.1 NAD(P)/FAD-dependent oxidoreductase [Sulfurovum indicum]